MLIDYKVLQRAGILVNFCYHKEMEVAVLLLTAFYPSRLFCCIINESLYSHN